MTLHAAYLKPIAKAAWPGQPSHYSALLWGKIMNKTTSIFNKYFILPIVPPQYKSFF